MIATHPRLFRLVCLLLMLTALACAWLFPFPLHAAPLLRLSASITRTEYMTGERFTITTHLFNDGDEAIRAGVLIADDGTFARISPPYDKPPTVLPGRSVPFRFTYQVLGSTPRGLHMFTVWSSIGGQAQQITIRVQPVVAPPAQVGPRRVYLAVFRH
jgi:hypothetical protein